MGWALFFWFYIIFDVVSHDNFIFGVLENDINSIGQGAVAFWKENFEGKKGAGSIWHDEIKPLAKIYLILLISLFSGWVARYYFIKERTQRYLEEFIESNDYPKKDA